MPDQLAAQTLNTLVEQFLDPRKRIFWGYLISGAAIALMFFVLGRQHSWRHSVQKLFSARVWLSASARADYWLILINQAIMLMLSPTLLSKVSVATAVYYGLLEYAGLPGLWQGLGASTITVCFTLCLFLLDDGSRYALHRLMHRIPWLWCFHRVHHSARTMTPLTVYRVHPVEGILYVLRSALVQGLCTGLFVYVFGPQVDLLSILGASVFIFFFNLFGANLRHSHVPFAYWRPLEYLLISPFQHQLHHSSARQHFNKNYGAVLAIWDYWGGSLARSASQSPPRFGVTRRPAAHEQHLYTLYITPMLQAMGSIRSGRLKRRPSAARWRPEKPTQL